MILPRSAIRPLKTSVDAHASPARLPAAALAAVSAACGLLMLAAALPAPPARAAGAAVPPPGASACSGCHGASSSASVGPTIAGRPAAEIAAAMEQFRTDARPATVMQRIAKGFTPEETRAIAEWWASRPEARP